MKNKRLLRNILWICLFLGFLSIGIFYTLQNRHQAIIKTAFLHKTGILDKNWYSKQSSDIITLNSPIFWVDGIYKSMEGPKSTRPVQITNENHLIWLQGFEIKAIDPGNKEILSNEYICHMNIDLIEQNYYSRFELNDRIGKHYPRLTSLSHGQESFSFPEGYGFPLYSNEIIYVTTQTLNHNYPKISQRVQHEIQLSYTESKKIKPLMSKTVYIQLPYEWSSNDKSPLDGSTDLCIPVETKNHSYVDNEGNKLSGHWKIPIGKNIYRSEINDHLLLTDSLRLHAAAVHVHPFATSITLFDKSDNKALFVSKIENYKDKIGLSKIESFSSEEGVWMYPHHNYELILEVNNTSVSDQDMMGSMFLFFYDEEMDHHLISKGLKEL